MADSEKIVTYLSSAAFQDACKASKAGRAAPFITISRQAGAGGSSLARAMLYEMGKTREEPPFGGWHVLDAELCGIVAQDPRLSVFYEGLAQESFRSDFADYLARFFANESPQFVVLKRVFETIRAAAGVGKAVIVGRGASCLTRSLPLGVHVRLVAPKPVRARVLMKRLALDRAQAEKRLEELDDARARLVKTYFLRDIDDPLLYDAVWNTDAVSLPEIASVLVKMVKDRYQAHEAGRSAPVITLSRPTLG